MSKRARTFLRAVAGKSRKLYFANVYSSENLGLRVYRVASRVEDTDIGGVFMTDVSKEVCRVTKLKFNKKYEGIEVRNKTIYALPFLAKLLSRVLYKKDFALRVMLFSIEKEVSDVG